MDLRELKGYKRRKQIRKLIRQGYKEIEIADKLNVDITTVSRDVSIILQENTTLLLANKDLITKDLEGLLQSLKTLNEIDEECWKIYYSTHIVKDKEGKILKDDKGVVITKEMAPEIKLQTLEKVRQNNLDRAKLLKLLNPTQINVEKLVYVEKMMPVLINKVINVVLDYIPKEKQVEVLEKLKIIDIEEG